MRLVEESFAPPPARGEEGARVCMEKTFVAFPRQRWEEKHGGVYVEALGKTLGISVDKEVT